MGTITVKDLEEDKDPEVGDEVVEAGEAEQVQDCLL